MNPKQTKRNHMKNIFIINGHEAYEFSKGTLNKSFVERLQSLLPKEEFAIKTTTMKETIIRSTKKLKNTNGQISS
jgi:methanogenic corrinoid protein MtbC1